MSDNPQANHLPPKLSKPRSTKSKKAAQKYLQYFNFLLDALESSKPESIFLATDDFNHVSPSTLHNRFTDALSWLRENNMDGQKDNRHRYEHLRQCMHVRSEASGIRATTFVAPAIESVIRTGAPVAEPSDWKTEVAEFLSTSTPSEPVRKFTNCQLSEEGKTWLSSLCSSLGAKFEVKGDIIIVAKVG